MLFTITVVRALFGGCGLVGRARQTGGGYGVEGSGRASMRTVWRSKVKCQLETELTSMFSSSSGHQL